MSQSSKPQVPTITPSFASSIPVIMSLESGNVSMADVRQAVAKLKLYNIDMHHIVKSTPGPLGTTDLPILDLSSGGFMKCFIDVIVDVPSFPITKIKQLMQDQCFKSLPKPYGRAKDVDAPFRIALTWPYFPRRVASSQLSRSSTSRIKRTHRILFATCAMANLTLWTGQAT